MARIHLCLGALQFLLVVAAPLPLHADEHTLEDHTTLSSETDAGPGLWSVAPERANEATPSDEQRRTIEQLQAIGYVAGSSEPRGNGITLNDPARAWPGINLYTSGHEPVAILMDMEGRELHRWKFEYRDAFPDSIWVDHPNTAWWRRAYLYPNGDLLAIVEGFALLKLDKNSELLWASPVSAHHDLDIRPNGDIYVLTREASIIPRVNPEDPVLEDFITILRPDGTEKQKVSLLEAFESSKFENLYRSQNRNHGDLFHTNSLEVLDDRLSKRMPAFRAERILISMNNLSVIAVVDLDQQRVEWAVKGGSRGQHDPKILDDGHLLLFDNRSTPGVSKVLEFDLSKGRTVWQYRGTKQHPFFSKHLGTAQRLPNGNTLITESESGRAFEVSHDKRIVWEFFNPHRAGENDRYIATIFELLRLPLDFPLDWLPKHTGG
ncbi:MAG: aryl-sulfate sulfotransferase [Deltaproteobacteria bacterium]|nr:aryl-sulfate sulfotransferase [Deltaproteobacteria bacterium]